MSELINQLVTSIANDRRSDEKKDKKTLPALTNLHIQRASADTRLYIGADQGSREFEMLYIFKSKKKKLNCFQLNFTLELEIENGKIKEFRFRTMKIPKMKFQMSDVRLCVKEC